MQQDQCMAYHNRWEKMHCVFLKEMPFRIEITSNCGNGNLSRKTSEDSQEYEAFGGY